ncbi:MAG: FKBP-type peptidyl-prolyl cis-trans isomerase [Spirochaetes bacterium]|nr:FKBP-type peptidyl-prolyl cis-trans isomerase [Spirochaetota bacterium]
MDKAKNGDIVIIFYSTKSIKNKIIDSCKQSEKLIVGHRSIFPELNNAIIGMYPGDKKIIKIKQPYGPYKNSLIFDIDKIHISDDLDPKKGDELLLHLKDKIVPVKVLNISDPIITIDANHEMAGEDMFMDFKLINII